MRILWIDPIAADENTPLIAGILQNVRRPDTQVDLVALPPGRKPRHLEYHAYESLVVGDIVQITHALAGQYDAIVIGCFYDVGLREAREVSGQAVVTAPCQASLAFAAQLGNTVSILVGRRKWVPKMRENVHLYGHGGRLASFRSLNLGVLDFQVDPQRTQEIMLLEGQKAVEEDGAEVLILGCTAEFGFHETLQEKLGVPVIDTMLAPFKYAEILAEAAHAFGWYPSRKWGSESPPEAELEAWGLFKKGKLEPFDHDIGGIYTWYSN